MICSMQFYINGPIEKDIFLSGTWQHVWRSQRTQVWAWQSSKWRSSLCKDFMGIINNTDAARISIFSCPFIVVGAGQFPTLEIFFVKQKQYQCTVLWGYLLSHVHDIVVGGAGHPAASSGVFLPPMDSNAPANQLPHQVEEIVLSSLRWGRFLEMNNQCLRVLGETSELRSWWTHWNALFASTLPTLLPSTRWRKKDNSCSLKLQKTAFSPVKSRLALGFHGCLFVCRHHAENGPIHRKMVVDCPLVVTSKVKPFPHQTRPGKMN